MSSTPVKAAEPKLEDKEIKVGSAEAAKEEKKELSIEDELLQNISLIGRAVQTIEPRFTSRVLRTLAHQRKKLNREAVKKVIEQAYPRGSKTGQSLIANAAFDALPAAPAKEEAMDVDAQPSSTPAANPAVAALTTSALPSGAATPSVPVPSGKRFAPPIDPHTQDTVAEVTVYLRLLLILANLDHGKIKEAQAFATETAELVGQLNRRTMDQLGAKVWFYLARTYELQGKLADLQPTLLATRQTAALRKDETLDITLLNLLLRSYLAQNQYDQADKLIARSPFDTSVNQAQTVRYLFYAGRLRAVQLNYALARDLLQGAIRRAPKDETAPGFVQLIYKYYIIVVLLTGVIPDRTLFRRPVLKQALVPYFQVVQAVRVGDVTAFQRALKTHEATFLADSTHFLILRLRHYVIKTALRSITLAYSRISLADVCVKLHLDSEEDTEYIVAKAIKDGVIEATIDHHGGYMQSKVARDVYETDEPSNQFGARVEHCQALYNETVRAMRYPADAHRNELDSAAEQRERDREIAQMLADSGDLDDDDVEGL